MTVKFAIVGTGWVAGEYLKAIHARNDAEVYGIVSSDTDRAQLKLDGLGIEARVYASYDEAVKDSNVDAVVLCSTPGIRAEQAALAAVNGKHIVIEKPMTMNREGLELMADAISKNPVKTVVSFVLRWNPMFESTKALIDDDALGRVYMAQIDYWHHIGPHYGQYGWSKTKELGGSSILSAGCHAVDAVRHFAGDITEVMAYSCRTWAHSDYEFDPNSIAIFKLKNGGLGKVSASIECKTPYRFNVHLLGEKGTIMDNKIYTHKLPGQLDYATVPTILPDSGDVSHHPFAKEMSDFMNAIHTNTTTRCDFFEGYKSMEVSFAIDESARTGQKVVIPT
ncbi:Gfo/Idh/MocA family oxidoreductase [Paenibacillus hemerocallicola]|uniref:Gfo/Idh/MocA family oxidoreductase n=1 Tax=Paenibacillus hemerocallicola TaxID=1172614 RepID=A0A5C4THN3_9BACL|nr:Gfo/Idh/MocA family oxidoreductase [Paenibacillus hemerocallicola]TNJ68176.1 Gfo/Idh/MocA family oxidoreductase [Paenibacillus hemerocallicola]